MATRALPVESRENASKTGKVFKFEAKDKPKRRTLQSIQNSSVKENRQAGKGAMKEETQNGKSRKKIKPLSDPVIVFEDKNKDRELVESGTQTGDSLDGTPDQDELAEADREALELMGGDAAPEQYWKLLAEERRQALNDTLEENEQLHKEVDSLRDENEKLSELASQAEYLSSFLQGVVSSDENDDSFDDEDYKTGDEQPNENDKLTPVTVEDSDSDDSVYSPAPTDLKACAATNTDPTSDSDSESSQSGKIVKQRLRPSKDVNSKRFSGEWVNVELDDEKVASTEIIQAEILATLAEDSSS